MSLIRLPPSTVKLIASSQVITSVSSVIKELMENSIDSGATHIEIKLEKNGFEKIEVKDDGCGIKKGDVALVCLPSYTSKISDFSDLDSLSSYGFRGEALTALCQVAQVSITTKSSEDKIASTYIYDSDGQVTCSKASHILKGTVVTVTDLFKILPVRKQYMSNSKKASEELKKVDKIVKCLGMVHPRLRVTLVHNKFLIWQKSSVANLRQSVMQVIPLSIVKHLYHHISNTQQIRVECLIPKSDCEIAPLCFSNFSDASFLFINNRPVRHKEIEKIWYGKMFEYFGVYVPVNKNPISVMSITVPADCIDVNLEPNKTRVYLKNQDDVFELIKQCLHLYYGDIRKENEEKKSSPSKQNRKRKIEDECLVTSTKKTDLDCPTEMGGSGDQSRSKQLQSCVLNSDSIETNCEIQDNIELRENSQGTVELVSCKIIRENNCSTYKNLRLAMDETHEKVDDKKLTDDRMNNLGYEMDFRVKESLDNVIETTQNKHHCLNARIASEDFIASEENSYQNIAESQLIESRNTELMINKWKSDSSDRKVKNCISEHSESNVNKFSIEEASKLFLTEFSTEDSPCLENSCSLRNTEPTCIKENNLLVDKAKSDKLFSGIHVDYCKDLTNNSKNIIDENIRYNEYIIKKSSDVTNIEESSQAEPGRYKQIKLQECVAFSTPTLSQWSKGDVKSSSGANIEGPGVLASKSPITESPVSLSNRSVSSQMGCKDMSAFTKFARTMRKKILEESPNTCFTKVAQQLQDKWRNLNDDEKNKYEDKKIVVKTTKSKEKQATLDSSLTSLNNVVNIEIDVNIENLQAMIVRRKKADEIEANNQAELIGQLDASGVWLFFDRHSGLAAASSTRLLEAVKFHKHLETFSVPKMLLDHPITVLYSELGEDAWRHLLALSRSPNGVITDPRITHNGFFVEVTEGEQEVQISHVAQNISYYGTEELGEVLGLIGKHGSHASLSQCRPLKVICFLRSEVMRECLKSEEPDAAYVRNLLHYWSRQVAPNCYNCIHHLPVTHILDTS